MHGDDSDSDAVYNDEGENDERFDVDGWSDFTWPSRTVAIFHPCLRQRLATGKDGIIKLGLLVFKKIFLTQLLSTNSAQIKCVKYTPHSFKSIF